MAKQEHTNDITRFVTLGNNSAFVAALLHEVLQSNDFGDLDSYQVDDGKKYESIMLAVTDFVSKAQKKGSYNHNLLKIFDAKMTEADVATCLENLTSITFKNWHTTQLKNILKRRLTPLARAMKELYKSNLACFLLLNEATTAGALLGLLRQKNLCGYEAFKTSFQSAYSEQITEKILAFPTAGEFEACQNLFQSEKQIKAVISSKKCVSTTSPTILCPVKIADTLKWIGIGLAVTGIITLAITFFAITATAGFSVVPTLSLLYVLATAAASTSAPTLAIAVTTGIAVGTSLGSVGLLGAVVAGSASVAIRQHYVDRAHHYQKK